MKKKIVGSVALALVLLCVWFAHKSITKLQQKEKVQDTQQTLSLIGEKLGMETLDSQKPAVLIYFNSECHFCQYEVKEISKNLSKFKQYQLGFMSFEPEIKAKNFLKEYGLQAFYLSVDENRLTTHIMGGVPQVFIYDDNSLKKHFKGEVKIEAILKVLE